MRAIRCFGLMALLLALCVGCGGNKPTEPVPESKGAEFHGSKGGPPGGKPVTATSGGIEGDYVVVGRDVG